LDTPLQAELHKTTLRDKVWKCQTFHQLLSI
jgi:hypothetical protein